MKWVVKLLIILLVLWTGYNLAQESGLLSIIIPALFLFVLIAIFNKEKKGFSLPISNYLGAGIGILLGLIIASLLGKAFYTLPDGDYVSMLITALLAYLGYSIGISKGTASLLSELGMPSGRSISGTGKQKLLDTSVIIDGRIFDICDTGFVEGALIVPEFILNELQHIADSTDHLKRTRGRRGLDILDKLQKHPSLVVKIIEKDFPKIKEVDSKLIALARDMDAIILTNDFNLNKVAQIQGVTVLNINQLANAMKPTVLPGESLQVRITKQGKEKGQGVAYLDDGTMVVVEQGEELFNKDIEVVVTSILQTPAGRMIFAAPKDENI